MTKENYKNLYDSLIQHRKCCPIITNKKNQNYVYHENHHIIMKTMGGSNDKDNLISLYAREHFLAHKMLMHIYADTEYEYKTTYAFWKMCYCHKDQKYHLDKTSLEFQKEKEFATSIIQKHVSNRIRVNNGKEMHYIKANELDKYLQNGYIIGMLPMSENTKRKMSQSRLGHPGYNKGMKRSKESIQKMLAHKSPESFKTTLNKIRITNGIKEILINKNEKIPNGWWRGRSNKMKNIIPWNKGLKTGPLSDECKKKRSENAKGKKHYTNGSRNIFVYPGAQPDGFYPGQINHK